MTNAGQRSPHRSVTCDWRAAGLRPSGSAGPRHAQNDRTGRDPDVRAAAPESACCALRGARRPAGAGCRMSPQSRRLWSLAGRGGGTLCSHVRGQVLAEVPLELRAPTRLAPGRADRRLTANGQMRHSVALARVNTTGSTMPTSVPFYQAIGGTRWSSRASDSVEASAGA